MHYSRVAALALAISPASAFPFVLSQPGVDASRLRTRQQPGTGAGSLANCPVNPNHVPAVPVNDKFPYNNAKNGLPGNGKGGYRVPDPNDPDHQFIAPDYSKDIRGPCPGLNTMANYGFIARDGIVTFDELVDGQQNFYNLGYDLSILLAVLGLTTTDGDIVTERLSIGCDATPRTSFNPVLTGSQPGLSGHNKFEADSSLTRNDFFTHDGDNFRFNATLWTEMANVCQGDFGFECMAKYRFQRYQESRAENRNFYFGPFSLLLYGASAFVYEGFPGAETNFVATTATTASFFGATQRSDGSWFFNGKERVPEPWTIRSDPFDILKIGVEIFKQYAAYPVEFGGNTADGQFDVISGPMGIVNGKFNPPNATVVSCLLYQAATERIPSSLNSILTPTVEALSFALNKLSPGFDNLGCPMPLT